MVPNRCFWFGNFFSKAIPLGHDMTWQVSYYTFCCWTILATQFLDQEQLVQHHSSNLSAVGGFSYSSPWFVVPHSSKGNYTGSNNILNGNSSQNANWKSLEDMLENASSHMALHPGHHLEDHPTRPSIQHTLVTTHQRGLALETQDPGPEIPTVSKLGGLHLQTKHRQT